MVIYQLLLALLTPALVLFVLRESRRRQGGWRFLRERLGFAAQPAEPCPIWIHAASVGEVMASMPLLRAAAGQHNTLVTTNTPEAARLLIAELGDAVSHCYCPLDFAWAVRRLIRRYQPRQLYVMETELWPNLFAVAEREGLASVIVNGRLSPKTLEAPRFVQALYRRLLQRVAAVWARSHADAEGFQALGCDDGKIAVLGNIKYVDVLPRDLPCTPAVLAGRPYVLAASTHHDEEMQLAKLWATLASPPLLVLLPRHPARASAIVQQLRALGWELAQRSRGDAVTDATQIYLADTVGELKEFAHGAEWVFMGGSLVPVGGHNVLEPAAMGKAVVTGRYLDNFREEADYLTAHGALLTVQDIDELRAVINRLLANPSEIVALGSHARAAMLAADSVGERYRAAFNAQLTSMSDAPA